MSDPIRLPCRDILADGQVDPLTLPEVEIELNDADVQYFEYHGWERCDPRDFTERQLPELGPVGYTNTLKDVVITIRGRNYRVAFEDNSWRQEDAWEAVGKTLVLTPTDELPSDLIREQKARLYRSRYYYQFFGQPHWIQNAWYPKDKRGNPCYHLMSIENGWGDSGNFNILVGLDENGVPDAAYFEASCC